MQSTSSFAVRPGSSIRIMTAMLVCAVIASVSLFSQAPTPREGATTPVQVVNTSADPVPVTGTVTGEVTLANSRINAAVLNDIVDEPYLVSRSQSFVTGDATPFEFDVPDGMRLIVESITVRLALRAPGNAVLQFAARRASGGSPSGELALLQQGAITDSFMDTLHWIVGTHAIKLRIDAVAGRDDELILALRISPVAGTANALVAGYLVPLE